MHTLRSQLPLSPAEHVQQSLGSGEGGGGGGGQRRRRLLTPNQKGTYWPCRNFIDLHINLFGDKRIGKY